jgi:anti-anti-sigma factor
MSIEAKEVRGVTVIKLRDTLNSSLAVELKHYLEELLMDGRTKVVLNMRLVKKVNRVGLSVLIERLAEFRHHDGDLKLAGVRPLLMRYLNLLGVGGIFVMCQDECSAINSFQQRTLAQVESQGLARA